MKIICIGRNYADHAKEMNSDLPNEPIFFFKPDTALTREKTFYLPKFTSDLHFECEIVVKIDKAGKNIPSEFAHKYYSQITLGIDFTARDLQQECKEKGLPWERAKAFDNSAPLSDIWINKKELSLENLSFQFFQNDELKQDGNTKNMIFSIDRLISYVSQFVTLKTGDLIFTGTPSGVGAVSIGDELAGFINGKKVIQLLIA
ncbi:MAG: FAA hydrolase family protein [Flavobacteriales bacterium]|nr:FAA hydrolase family protein [Flavobacteriales bacterium]